MFYYVYCLNYPFCIKIYSFIFCLKQILYFLSFTSYRAIRKYEQKNKSFRNLHWLFNDGLRFDLGYDFQGHFRLVNFFKIILYFSQGAEHFTFRYIFDSFHIYPFKITEHKNFHMLKAS